ncbi:MAG: acireductone synthase [Methylococcales bacterium]|nr:acireductone synthase [Methylococcales bacterium]
MIKAVITDIEGTTTSLSFVKDTLFPYSRTHIADFVRNHAHESPVKTLLEDVCQVVGEQLTTEQIIIQLLDWIDQDKKVTPLKSLQGLLWEAGYQKGDFAGHLYQDVAENLKKWHSQGLALYVYSSGSVHAQKLLFTHTNFGDLTPLFSGYFDTHIGGKQQTSSYSHIAESIGLPAEQLLFLSDISEELNAAKAAGFATIQLVRDAPLDTQATHTQVASFNDISI